MAKVDKICKTCVFWLPGTSIKDYGYCVKKDCYRPWLLTCDKWQAKSEYLRNKEGEACD